jgi:hypothetical protein
MPLSKARQIVFFIWAGAFLVYVFMFELAPSIRGSMLISRHDAHLGCLRILALVVPVLSAFSTFWWRRGAKRSGTVSKESWLPALLITGGYHLILFVLLLDVIFVEQYENTDVTPGATFSELVTNVMQLGLLLSAVAIAPVAQFLGIEQIEIANLDQEETKPQ